MGGDRYVLREQDREEVRRLELQHEAWWDVTRDALRRAGFATGHRVADVGCGPGDLTLELARAVGPTGGVLAVDGSEHFITRLRERVENQRLSWVQARVADVREPWAETESLDGAVCRWVLMFVAEPERAVAQIASALKPGGTFLAMEYDDFRSMALHPEGEAFARTYGAVHRLITDAGGDPDLGGRLPALLEEAGLEVTEVHPVLRVGRPGEPLWRWLEATHGNHANLVEAGLLSEAELQEYYREWQAASRRPAAFFTAPPVLMVVARKR